MNGFPNFQTQNSQVRSKCVVYLITIYAELLICDYVGTAIAAEVSISSLLYWMKCPDGS